MENCRTSWLSAMLKIVSPVLDALEKGELKTSLPLGFHPDRADFAPLEAFGRSLLGLAPWLELEGLEGEEARLQSRYREKVLQCIAMASDPASPDFMNFCQGGTRPFWPMPWCGLQSPWRGACRKGPAGIWSAP